MRKKMHYIMQKKNWYQYIFEKMNSKFDDFAKNNVSFITFNYDRSLKYYFFTSLKNSYGKTDQEIYEKVKKIPIIHLHGKLGDLPWEAKSETKSISYGESDEKKIDIASSSIKIIHEDFENNDGFEEAYKLMRFSDRVYILGFGYHPINMKRLKLENANASKIIGSAYDLTDKEVGEIIQKNNLDHKLILQNIFAENLDFLRQYCDLD